MATWWEKHNPIATLRRRKKRKIDKSQTLGPLNELRTKVMNTKAKAYKDYEEADAFYTSDADWIFRDWTSQEDWEDWMSTIHEPKFGEAIDAILSNLVPAFPRPMVAAVQPEHNPLAEAGDALLWSGLFLGGYNMALARNGYNMAKYNTSFMMPSIDRVTFYPDVRVVIEVDPPHNVLLNTGATCVKDAAQLVVCRRLHKERMKALYPEISQEIENLKGRNPFQQKSGHDEGMTSLNYGGWSSSNEDDSDDVSLELFWRIDPTKDKISDKDDLNKAYQENGGYFEVLEGRAQQIPEDKFEVWDIHDQHIPTHEEVKTFIEMTYPGYEQHPAYVGIYNHLAKHYAAKQKGAKGGEKWRYRHMKRFSMIIGGSLVYYDDECPYSDFGIREFPLIDFQLTIPPLKDYWDIGVARRIIDLNKKRNRLSNSVTDNVMLAGHPMLVKAKGGPEDPDRKTYTLNEIQFEDQSTLGTTRFVSPDTVTADTLALATDTDRQIDRATGIYAAFRGESLGRMSGKALEELNTQGGKIIDLKLVNQQDAIARLGDMVFKIMLGTCGPQEKAIIAGEYGAVHVQDIDVEKLRQLEYKVTAIPGQKDMKPFDQKMEAFMATMAQIGPIFGMVPGGQAVMMEIAVDFAKGITPEFEKYEPKLRKLVEMLYNMPPPQPDQGGGNGQGQNVNPVAVGGA